MRNEKEGCWTLRAARENSLGAESMRDGRPSTDDAVVEAIDEETSGEEFQPDCFHRAEGLCLLPNSPVIARYKGSTSGFEVRQSYPVKLDCLYSTYPIPKEVG